MTAVVRSHPAASTALGGGPRRLAALAALLPAALLLAGCGGSGSGGSPPPGSPALEASPSGQLVAHVRALLVQRDAQRQRSPNQPWLAATGSAPTLAVSATSGTPVDHSNTTVQEAGVDEDDLIKTDGQSVYSLDTTGAFASPSRPMRLLVHRRDAGGDIAPVQTLALPFGSAPGYVSPRGMQLAAAARRAVVLSEVMEPIGSPSPCPPEAVCIAPASLIYPPIQLKSTVELQFLSLDASGLAQLGDKIAIDGRLIASRRIDHTLVLVTMHAPRLAYELLPAGASAQLKADTLAQLTAADVLPQWRPAQALAQPLVPETDCYVQPANASLMLEITTITVIDMTTLSRKGRCFVGGAEAVYMSPKSLVLSTSRLPYRILDNGRIVYPLQFVTDLHRFAFDGSGVDYRASGEVAGHLGWDPSRKPYRVSEADNGDLRVLTFTGDTGWALPADAESAQAPAPSPAMLTVLRESAGERALKALATLPNAQRPAPLGKPGEQVHAVRFAGDRGYVVTFRRVDPLYVIDLSSPADPRIAGELTVPGFSDYLFPLANGLLFGVGKDITANNQLGGVKLGLFDVSDPAQPRAIGAQVLGSSGSASGLDFSSHGINLLQRGDTMRIALPVSLTSTPYAANPAHGLQRVEVDTRSGTLTARALLPSPAAGSSDLWGDRSAQIGDQLVYLSGGQVTVAGWSP
jgi:hypothetical protein